jgi:hypothetical protein
MRWGRPEARRPARGTAALTAAGPVGLALVSILFSSATAARPAGPAPTPTPTMSPTVSASPTATSGSDDSRSDISDGLVTPTCEVRSIYKIITNRSRDFWIPGTHFVDGPGGAIKVWVEREHHVETSLLIEKEARLQFDFNSFVAEVRKMVSPIIITRIRVELGHEFARRIRKGRYGHVRYRVFGYKIGFRQWRQFGDCSIRFAGSGLAFFPTSKQGWKYWETRSP